MGRYSSIPTTVESCLSLSLKELKKWDYLKPDSYKSGTITHSRGERKTASYNIIVSTYEHDSYVQFKYTIGGTQEIDYKVKLIRFPTNIGNGFRYYFVCPHTGKRCYKLYSPPSQTYFLHRSAFPFLIYEKQTHCKKYRALEYGAIGLVFRLEEMEKKLLWDRKKYQKNWYGGKPTKKMQRYFDLRDRLCAYSIRGVEREFESYL